jgi:hypothetical protein
MIVELEKKEKKERKLKIWNTDDGPYGVKDTEIH